MVDFRSKLRSALAAALLLLAPVSVQAAQFTYTQPTTGPQTMSSWAAGVNSTLGAVLSCNSGATAPAVTGQPSTYQCWVDTSTTPRVFKFYDGASWVATGTLDTSGHLWGVSASTLKLLGSSSGTATITPQAAAGTPTITLPNATGTLADGASAPLALSATTGNLTITGAAGQVLAGASPAFTATPTLGVAGSTVGTLAFANATSGTITVSPPTGALGAVTLTLPDATDTLVGKATTDTLTGKTIGGNSVITNSNGTIGSANSFWTSSGSPRIQKVQDRLFVGAAAAVNTGNAPESPADWLQTLVAGTTQNAQFVSLNTLGLIGIIGGSRSSDWPAAGPSSIGGAFYAENDNVANPGPAWAAYAEAHRESGVTGLLTTALELDTMNNGSTVDITPSNFFPAGATTTLSLGSGASAGVNPVTAAIAILNNGTKFRKGIIFKDSALDTALGTGTAGVAIEMARNQSIRWLNSSDVMEAEIWGNASGLNIASPVALSGAASTAITTTVTGSGSAATFVGTNSTNTRTTTVGNLDGFNGGINVNSGNLNLQRAGASNVSLTSAQTQFLVSPVVVNTSLRVGSTTSASGARLQVDAGTTALAPIGLIAGTNLTTAAAGATEYDGTAFYDTSVASSRQVRVTEQFSALTTDFTGTNVNTAQPVFSTAQDVATLAASTSYSCEAEYEIDTTGTTSHQLGVLFGGTATFTSLAYSAVATNGAASGTSSAPLVTRSTVATVTNITAAVAAATQNTVRLRGIFRINGAGTLIPQFQYSAAPGAAPTVKANSFFRCWPLGADTSAFVGNWG